MWITLMGTDEMMADEVALMEEAELEALASMSEHQATRGENGEQILSDEDMGLVLFAMEGQGPTAHTPQGQQPTETPYGSDDDEYDHIFMGVIEEENRKAIHSSQPGGRDLDMMDMS